MTNELAEIEAWVRAEVAAARQPGIIDISGVVAHPTLELVACTLTTRTDADVEPTRHVAVVALESRRCQQLDLGAVSSTSAAWSPDGRHLALLVTGDGSVPTAWVVGLADAAPEAAEVVYRLPEVGGAVEELAWSPSGDQLCLVVAQFGAEVSDVYGSGTVQGPAESESWRPTLSPAPDSGRRIVHLWSPASGTVEPLCPGLNVWQSAWYGPDRLLALASEGSGEGAWYAAILYVIGLDGTAAVLHRPATQLAQPSANSEGTRWSVIAARASDRGLLAGDLLVGEEGAPGRRQDTGGVDVTAHYWVDEHRVAFAGIRGLETVFGVQDTSTETVEERATIDGSSGLYQPEAGALTAGASLVTVVERHDQPPALIAVNGGVTRTLLSTSGQGTAHIVRGSGRTTLRSWTSSDGQEIQGVLTVPDVEGPHPLVVNVHGGPVAAWRNGWIGKDPYAALLVARGFAVLRPNPRGSAGRGQEFIEAIVGDMGGRDVDDIVLGVQALVEAGIADAERVGITGNSYGGYMAAWIPCLSDVFAASVSRSPVTDFRSQHLTGNLAEFDEIFVGGDPFDPGSRYSTRSPLMHYRRIKTPMLFTAGARDLATPASQAQLLHRALLKTDVPTELVVYPEEGHGVRAPDALADQIARMIAWFETHLKVDPATLGGHQ